MYDLYVLVFFQYCHNGYRISYTIIATPSNQKTPKLFGSKSFAACYDTGIYEDTLMNGTFDSFTLTLKKCGRYITLGELEVYIGQDNPSPLKGSNLKQDAPRTWLVVDGLMPTSYDIDELDVKGYGHLAIQNNASQFRLSVQDYKGDFTGTLHIGSKQQVNLSRTNNSVIPFTVRAYQVCVHQGNITFQDMMFLHGVIIA